MRRRLLALLVMALLMRTAELMAADPDWHWLVVTEGSRVAGMLTDRDIRLNLPSPATTLSVWEITASVQ